MVVRALVVFVFVALSVIFWQNCSTGVDGASEITNAATGNPSVGPGPSNSSDNGNLPANAELTCFDMGGDFVGSCNNGSECSEYFVWELDLQDPCGAGAFSSSRCPQSNFTTCHSLLPFSTAGRMLTITYFYAPSSEATASNYCNQLITTLDGPENNGNYNQVIACAPGSN